MGQRQGKARRRACPGDPQGTEGSPLLTRAQQERGRAEDEFKHWDGEQPGIDSPTGNGGEFGFYSKCNGRHGAF